MKTESKRGGVFARSQIHKQGLWHRIVVVAILDKDNDILMQQRSKNKDKNPNVWDISVTGHISSGQDSLSAACREIREEIGLKIKEQELRYMFSYRKEQFVNESHFDRQYYDFFILRKQKIDISKIQIQASEVQQVRMVSMTELAKMIEKKKVVERDETYQCLFDFLKFCGNKDK